MRQKVLLPPWIALGALATLVAFAGCERVAGPSAIPTEGPTATPTTSATPSTSPSPSACETPDINNPNLVVVAMADGVAETNIAPYGAIEGYGVVDAEGDIPVQAALINETGAGTPLTATNTIQFVNAETASIYHSAYGFTGNAFPPATFTFPSPVPSPTGVAITSKSTWFTGRIAPQQSTGPCYSQEFTLSAGTYYFGDYDYYGALSFRDVMVVGTPAPAVRRHARSPSKKIFYGSQEPSVRLVY